MVALRWLRAGFFLNLVLLGLSLLALSHRADASSGSILAYVERYGEGTQARILDIAHQLDHWLYNDVDCQIDWADDGRILILGRLPEQRHSILSLTPGGSEIARLTPPDSYTTAAAVSPDGRILAYAANRIQENAIFLVPLDTLDSHKLASLPAWINQILWSPDGASLAALGVRDNRFASGYVLTMTGELHDLPNAARMSWSADSSSLRYSVSQGGALTLYDYEPASGVQQPIQPGEGVASLLLWSPDGHQAAYIVNQDEFYGIDLYDTVTGQTSSLVPPLYTDIPLVRWSPHGDALLFSARPAAAQRAYRLLTPYNLYLVHLPDGAVQRVRSGFGQYVNNFSYFCALAWSR